MELALINAFISGGCRKVFRGSGTREKVACFAV